MVHWYSHDSYTGRHLPYGITQCYLLGCYPTQVNAPRLNPSPQAGTQFTYPGGIESCVDQGYPVMQRPGVELATFRSQVQRHNNTPPSHP